MANRDGSDGDRMDDRGPARGQEVTKETVEGVTNFNRLETTVACAGATKSQAVAEIKKMGSHQSSTSARQ